MASPNPIISPATIGAIPTTEKAAALGVATLGADSKIPSAQLPAIAITDVFPVASQVAMLALTAQRGDVAVRSDISKTFILSTDDPTILANWLEITTPFQFGYVAGDLPIGTGPNILAPLNAGAVGKVLKMGDVGLPVWEDRQNLSKEIFLYENWIGDAVGQLRWLDADIGTGDSHTGLTHQDVNHPGILELATGASATGAAVRTLGGAATGAQTSGFRLGGGRLIKEWLVRLDTLSTAVQEYTMSMLLTDLISGPTAFVGFMYSRTTSVNWLGVTRSGGVTTSTSTGIPVATGVWVKLRCEVNALATQVDFYVNDVLVASNTTNIPTTTNVAPRVNVTSSVGTTSKVGYVNYFWLYQRLTTPR